MRECLRCRRRPTSRRRSRRVGGRGQHQVASACALSGPGGKAAALGWPPARITVVWRCVARRRAARRADAFCAVCVWQAAGRAVGLVARGLLLDHGRRAVVPAQAVQGAARIWVRNGLGRTAEARPKRETGAPAFVMLEFRRPLGAPDDAALDTLATGVFAGSPGPPRHRPAHPKPMPRGRPIAQLSAGRRSWRRRSSWPASR
jgi:hypothetical protein